MKLFNIIKYKSLKIQFLKNEYKYIILKSIIQSSHKKLVINSVCQYKFLGYSKRSKISFQKKVCLLLGKHRSIYAKLSLKRHSIKKLNVSCEIPNLTISRW